MIPLRFAGFPCATFTAACRRAGTQHWGSREVVNRAHYPPGRCVPTYVHLPDLRFTEAPRQAPTHHTCHTYLRDPRPVGLFAQAVPRIGVNGTMICGLHFPNLQHQSEPIPNGLLEVTNIHNGQNTIISGIELMGQRCRENVIIA